MTIVMYHANVPAAKIRAPPAWTEDESQQENLEK